MTSVALVCIAKNEDNYIQEWIDYNLKLGFDSIFVYCNDWSFSNNNRNVNLLNISGQNQQILAYNHFIENFNWKYDWAAFFDVDEFLVLHKYKNVKSFLANYSDCAAIGLNWYFFGSNGHQSISDDYSVIKRFTKRQKLPNKHIKSIVKLPCAYYMGIHDLQTTWFDTNKNPHNGPFNEKPVVNIAHINHYFTKSKEEFINKVNRGRADTVEKRDISEFDEDKNWNDVEDFSAYNFFYDTKESQ